ncbi:hypothetical protein QA600_08005 [Natronococcus sp. A-GB1]|uniref:hypothetical protein n=1 Tax=Natronococcus sp. A-GB1 TaxID=3037648 RepID=UPI00241CFDFC|nr:hypothetical protein [Natronococcus sp. A-GB1]MDG5759282.1 hypothetical protein [Natronococcus sp. A-GB1]
MAEPLEHQPVADRLVCPNCPADYPTPFSRRRISCRRCGTDFLAPDEARDGNGCPGDDGRETGPEARVEADRAVDDGSDNRIAPYLRTIRTSAPAIALGFNGVALGFWLAGAASFEIAVMSVLLVTNGVLFQDRL